MAGDFRLAMIGLDTSHSVEFPRLMQGDAPENRRISGLRVTRALRFPSPFQAEEGQDKRAAEIAAWGVETGTDFAKTVQNADGILLEINDPALHWTYFQKAAETGLPIFIDKPLADTVQNGRKIVELAQKKKLKCWSASSLRFFPSLVATAEKHPTPDRISVYGALGTAPAGSSLVWYGVHTHEMLNRLMGNGAKSVFAHEDEAGITTTVEYGGPRRGIVECIKGFWQYGGRAQAGGETSTFINDDSAGTYSNLMRQLKAFFLEGTAPIPLDNALEILAIMEAGERSLASGKNETVRM